MNLMYVCMRHILLIRQQGNNIFLFNLKRGFKTLAKKPDYILLGKSASGRSFCGVIARDTCLDDMPLEKTCDMMDNDKWAMQSEC